MKTGRSVKIFGERYKIKQKKDLMLDGEEVCGYCDLQKKEIFLRTGLDTKLKLQTFWHEIFHCVLFETSTSATLNQNVEEIIVDNLSRQVAEIMSKTLESK